MSGTRVAVLGAGPAGLAAALALAERGFEVEVFEQRAGVGGNAASFELGGLRVDYGSHRLHPAADPAVLATLRRLLGEDLLVRPRHGRIRLRGRWIHFPLRPAELARRLPPDFALGVARDALARALRRPGRARLPASFAEALEAGLGPTICREFYFPYARKIWGLEPGEISAEQARRRVSSGTLGSLVRRVLGGARPGGERSMRGRFYYPRRGFGQIAERLAEAAVAGGARLHLCHRVVAIRRLGDGSFEVCVAAPEGVERSVKADRVWSTLPARWLVELTHPPAPEDVRAAAGRLELRAMLLVYLVVEADRFSEYDAHYFPGPEVPFTRISEPKNYAGCDTPRGRTILCAEMPCSTNDPWWKEDERALGDRVREGLARAELALPGPVREVAVRRLAHAYPIYRRGYETDFERVDAWIRSTPGLLSFGRQGLFVHDNTHHALFMGQAAARCLEPDGRFDAERWERYRRVFETHVVED